VVFPEKNHDKIFFTYRPPLVKDQMHGLVDATFYFYQNFYNKPILLLPKG